MNEENSYFTKMLDAIGAAYKRYNSHFEIVQGDRFFQKTVKVLGRIVVMIIMILLSPFLMIGLGLAFAAVF